MSSSSSSPSSDDKMMTEKLVSSSTPHSSSRRPRRELKPTVSFLNETSYVHVQQQWHQANNDSKKKKKLRTEDQRTKVDYLQSSPSSPTDVVVTPVKSEPPPPTDRFDGDNYEEEQSRKKGTPSPPPPAAAALYPPRSRMHSVVVKKEKPSPDKNESGTSNTVTAAAATATTKSTSEEGSGTRTDVQIKTEPATTTPVVVKSEFIQHRLDVYNSQYIDRPLLRRSQKNGTVSKGIARLGGSTQDSYVSPGMYNKNIWTEDDRQELKQEYPFPSHVDQQRLVQGDQEALKHLSFVAYNGCYNPFAPQFAGQAYGNVSGVPSFFAKNKHLSFPVFVKRTKTAPAMTREGKLLGWEYCGNYRVSSDLENVWTPAANVSQAAKSKMELELIKSSSGQEDKETWGSKKIRKLTERLDDALSNTDTNDESANSLRQQVEELAQQHGLVYQPGGVANNNSDLAKILVNLDFYYEHWITIEFVEYDERIYNYCCGDDNDGSSTYTTTAREWYDFATTHGILQ